MEPRFPTLQAESLPAELQGKPKNTGVGSLSVLQGIFPTQKSNWGLQHCSLDSPALSWILYQLSYQGSMKHVNISTTALASFYMQESVQFSSLQSLSRVRLFATL